MEYINKRTGEVLEVGKVDLSNLFDGYLNMAFAAELDKLVTELNDGDKGSISIKGKVFRTKDVSGDDTVVIDAQMGTKYPNVIINDKKPKKVIEEGIVVQKIDSGMFEA